ncbi:hypothetical protein A9Q98_03030 [Thalassotalea sp. 42_200_T64]|nr:hypothetical protein A9Q98_03030 [Thalassotalea sp. 42_200_T64]
MWKAIADDISIAQNKRFVIEQTEQLSGGDINDCYSVTDGQTTYFVKINEKQRLNNFQSEANSLEHLAVCGHFIVPKVVTCGNTISHSYLVLEYLNMHCSNPQVTDQQWHSLGVALANLHHDNQQAEFGWNDDNYIGLTVQTNKWQHNWSVFFAEQRLGYQLQLLRENDLFQGSISAITDKCQQLLCHHHPTPSLVHGDLWQGNVAFVNNLPCIYDPACYYADREVDIAMSELFGRFPENFYQGYQQTLPLAKGYEQRKKIYNGYHILNHANLFAGIYVEQAQSFIHDIQSL